MLSGVCVGARDVAAAGRFYDAVLATIGMRCALAEPHERGYAGADGRIALFVVRPYDGRAATAGNGTQVMFYAPDADAVRAFHATALARGGTDEGAPGPRDYHPRYYGAYVRDPDGNKLNVSVDIHRERAGDAEPVARDLSKLSAGRLEGLSRLRITDEQAEFGGTFAESVERWRDAPTDRLLGIGFLAGHEPIGLALLRCTARSACRTAVRCTRGGSGASTGCRCR